MLHKKNYCDASPCPPSLARLLAFFATNYNATQPEPNRRTKNTSATLKLTNNNIAILKSMPSATK